MDREMRCSIHDNNGKLIKHLKGEEVIKEYIETHDSDTYKIGISGPLLKPIDKADFKFAFKKG